MSNNIITIGTALKWRGIYDDSKTYYQENIVTAGGCIFRCKASQTQGNAPLNMLDSEGHFTLINQGIWEVILDMSAHYNKVADTLHFAALTMETASELGEALANMGSFAKNPIRLGSEEEHDLLVETGGTFPSQIYYTTED